MVCFVCFDSILVRLKDSAAIDSVGGLSSFDSILVRLKDRNPDAYRPQIVGFDSILVRLKDDGETMGTETASDVSIPYWFD